ncbi:MAG: HAD family hydrolase [Deltaproteobacteria bacterium]|nr:HAD family hydrolase [Deltaproteobacteria bacterium]
MFDLDGTLIDTMQGFGELASELIARDYGLPRDEGRARYRETSGLPFREQLEAIFPLDPRNDATATEYERRKRVHCDGVGMDDQTVRALEALRRAGCRLVVSSNAAQRFVDDFARSAAVPFDAALGHSPELAKGPLHVQEACRRFGVTPREILFVGDSLHDARLAAESGVRFVGRLGTFSAEDFAAAFPRVPLVRSLDELVEVISSCT